MSAILEGRSWGGAREAARVGVSRLGPACARGSRHASERTPREKREQCQRGSTMQANASATRNAPRFSAMGGGWSTRGGEGPVLSTVGS